MADNFAQLVVQLELQQAAFTKGMNDAARRLEAVGKSAKKSQDDLGKMAQSFERLKTAATAAAAAFGSFKAIEGIAKAGDQIRTLEAQFTALTSSSSRGADMMQRLLDVTSRTGAPLEQTAAAMARFTIALKTVGATNAEVASLTETFLKLGAVGGASGQEAAAAMQQLGQALASGKFAGDELRSVMENTPLVAQAIADGMGVAVGKLRELGAQGKIGAKDVKDALLAAAAEANRAFAQLPDTYERATNRMQTATTLFLAAFDKTSGIGEDLLKTLNFITEKFQGWTAELQKTNNQFSAITVIAKGVGLLLEAVLVIFSDIAFTAEVLVRTIIALGIEAKNLTTGNFSELGKALKESEEWAVKARIALDAYQKSVLGLTAATAAMGREAARGLQGFVPGAGTGGGGGGGASGAAGAAEKELEALKKRGEAIAAMVNPQFAYNQAVAELNKIMQAGFISTTDAARAMQLYKDQLNATGDSVRASVDPFFAFQQEIKKLNELFDQGQISLETYIKALDKAREKASEMNGKKDEKTWADRLEDAIKSVGQAMGEFLGDLITGSATAEEAFKKMAQSIISMIGKMVAEALAAWVVKSLFEGAGGTTGTSGGGKPSKSATTAALSTAGLFATSAQTSRMASRLGRAGEPIQGKSIATVGQTRPELKVIVNNNAGALVSTRQDDAGNLEITVDRVRRALAADMARGGNVFANTLERSYNVARAGVSP